MLAEQEDARREEAAFKVRPRTGQARPVHTQWWWWCKAKREAGRLPLLRAASKQPYITARRSAMAGPRCMRAGAAYVAWRPFCACGSGGGGDGA